MPASVTERRVASGVSLTIVVLAIAMLPIGHAAGVQSVDVLSATSAVAFVTLALTAFSLLAQYRAGGKPSLAILSLAYAATAALILPYGLTLAYALGIAVVPDSVTQIASYLYVAWHVTFLGLVSAYIAVERNLIRCRAADVPIAAVVVSALVAAFVATAVFGGPHLPSILHGRGLTPFYYAFVVPALLGANVFAAVTLLVATRLRMRSHLWLTVVLLALIAETETTAFESSGIFSLGWYAARADLLLAFTAMLLVMQGQYSAILRRLADGNQRLTKRNAQIEALIRLQDDMASALPSRSAVIDVILEFARRETGASGAMMEIVEGSDVFSEAGSGTLVPFVGSHMPRNGSLAGLCADSKQVLRCDDTSTDERVNHTASQRMNIGSMVDVPLPLSTAVTVVLKVSSAAPFAFSPTDVQALQLAGSHLLSGLRAADECRALQAAEAEQRRYAQQLRALHLIASATKGHRKEQLDAAIRLGLEELDLDWGYIAVVDAGSGDVILENSVSRGDAEDAPAAGVHIRPEPSFVARIVASKDVIVIERRDSPNDPALERQSWNSYIAVPLFIDGMLFGAMGFIGREERERPFTEANVDFVRVAGDLVSSAIVRGRQSERLDELAFFDALTGLPNRVLLSDRLVQTILTAKRRDETFAVLFIDIDGFKAVNDRYGHGAGDEVLRLVARRLEKLMRESDTVARIGGDEFIVLAPKLRVVRDAWSLGNKILQALGQPMLVEGVAHSVGASIGIGLYPLDGKDSQSLIERADAAMYVAKSEGKNRVRFASVLGLEQDAGDAASSTAAVEEALVSG